MKDYYKILQVEKNASPDEIKKSFRKLAKKFHPDSNSGNKEAEEKFKEVNEAYSILGDESKKARYDLDISNQSESNLNRFNKKNTSKERNKSNNKMSESDFMKTDNMFENFFGFNPKGNGFNFNNKDENIKPMKTNEAFEKVFGKRRFK